MISTISFKRLVGISPRILYAQYCESYHGYLLNLHRLKPSLPHPFRVITHPAIPNLSFLLQNFGHISLGGDFTYSVHFIKLIVKTRFFCKSYSRMWNWLLIHILQLTVIIFPRRINSHLTDAKNFGPSNAPVTEDEVKRRLYFISWS